MKIQYLDESWQIVLVVTSENANQLERTLEDIQAKSFRDSYSILAQDTKIVRDAISQLAMTAAYMLPAKIETGCYWVTVLSSHNFESERTIFIQAGTRVPDCWDVRLVAAGQRAGASAISPQCARHPFLSAFASTTYQPELAVDEVDQWLNDYVEGIEYSVPILLESCALLQGDYWRDIDHLIQNDRLLLEDLRAKGACLLATDQLYIDDFKTKYSNDITFLPKAYIDACTLRPQLAPVRHALSELSSRREKPAALKSCLPVQLHVGHSWGGGLERWIEDYISADTQHNHLVLRSIGDLSGFGQTIALFRSTAMDLPIQTWTLSEPVISINIASFEYRKVIEELICRYSVESLVISSLVGHTLDLLHTSLPTTVVLHEFFPFCPALYATFGSPCISCSKAQLRDCFRENPRNSYFKFEAPSHWLAVREKFVQSLAQELITVIAPSRSVVDRYRRLESRLIDKQIHVVAHGLDANLADRLKSELTSSAHQSPAAIRLKIVILGRLSEEKGGELLSVILRQLSSFADLYLLGTGDSGARFSGCQGVTITEAYNKYELGALLGNIQPDLGMLLSTVPETFSYTLSELWAAGIPVLATRLGAFADRISDFENGWLVEPEAAAILDKLRELNLNRNLLEVAKKYVIQQPVKFASEMVSEYASLMPARGLIPLIRYNLPRRSYRNPYGQGLATKGTDALYVNYHMSYRQVLSAFLQYTAQKTEQSPKLPVWVRVTLGRWLHRTARYFNS